MALTEAEDSDILIYVKKIEVALFMSRISDASGAVDEIRKGTVPFQIMTEEPFFLA